MTQLLETPKEQWHPVLVAIDEVHRFAPQDGPAASKSVVANLPAVGRKRGFIAVYATQNIEQVDKDAIGYLPNRLCGTITMDNRRKRAADDFGLDSAGRARLKTMRQGQFYAQGPSFDNQTVLVSVPDTRTHKPRVGTAGFVSAPPTPSAIKALLAGFADLPDEAAQEAKTLAEARARIAELEKRVRETSNEFQGERRTSSQGERRTSSQGERRTSSQGERRTSSQGERRKGEPVVRVERVVERIEVPVFLPGEVAHLGEIADSLMAMAKDLAGEAQGIRARLSVLGGVTAPDPEFAERISSAGEAEAALPASVEDNATPATDDRLPSPVSKSPPPQRKPLPAPACSMSRPRQAILDALKEFAALGVLLVARSNVAVWCNVSPASSSYSNNLSALRVGGFITYPDAKTVSLTTTGAGMGKYRGSIKSHRDLRAAWKRRLPDKQAQILDYLADRRGQSVLRSELARASGSSATSSSFANNLSALRSLGLIDYPDRERATVTDLLFPAGLE